MHPQTKHVCAWNSMALSFGPAQDNPKAGKKSSPHSSALALALGEALGLDLADLGLPEFLDLGFAFALDFASADFSVPPEATDGAEGVFMVLGQARQGFWSRDALPA